MAEQHPHFDAPLPVRAQDLSGKVAVVTGASRGLGRAIALNLATRGCSVLATCSGPATLPLLDNLARDVAEHYLAHHSKFLTPRIVGLAADILAPGCAAAVADAVDRRFKGRLDIYVNNAGVTGASRVGEMDAALVQRYCVGNVQTPALVVDELVRRRMFRRESRIVLISSVRSKKSDARSAMYSATKAAGEALVRCWADAFGGKDPEYNFMSGTTANSVFVGLTKTDAAGRHPPEVLERYRQDFLPAMSMPRMAEVEDVADVVGLVCSKEAKWITGSVVSADGGGVKIC